MKYWLCLGSCVLGVSITALAAADQPFLDRNPEALSQAIDRLDEKARLALAQLDVQSKIESRTLVQRLKIGFKDFNYFPAVELGTYLGDIGIASGKVERDAVGPRFKIVVTNATVYFSLSGTGTMKSCPNVQVRLKLSINGKETEIESPVVLGKNYGYWVSAKRSPKTPPVFSEATYRALMLALLKSADLISAEEAQRLVWKHAGK